MIVSALATITQYPHRWCISNVRDASFIYSVYSPPSCRPTRTRIFLFRRRDVKVFNVSFTYPGDGFNLTNIEPTEIGYVHRYFAIIISVRSTEFLWILYTRWNRATVTIFAFPWRHLDSRYGWYMFTQLWKYCGDKVIGSIFDVKSTNCSPYRVKWIVLRWQWLLSFIMRLHVCKLSKRYRESP